MGLFGKGFGTGLAQGLAEGATRTIQTALDKREEEASAARKYMQTRRMQEAERYEQDMTETSELFDGFVQLTGGDMDKAAQLMKGAGGVEGGRTLLADLQTESRKNKDFNVLTAYTFAEAQAGEFGRDDYLRTLVRDPKSLALPQSKKIGLGLADKILGSEAKDMGISMPELSGQRIESLGTATAVPGAFSVAQEFETEQEAKLISLENAQLQNQKLMTEIEQSGALPVTQVKQSFATMVAGGLNRSKIPASVDMSGNVSFDLKDVKEDFEVLRSAYNTALKSITQDAVNTKALGVKGMKSILKTNAMQTLNYTEQTISAPTNVADMVVGEMYKTTAGIILYTGDGGLEEDDYIVIKQPE
jgi:hypothetical protein